MKTIANRLRRTLGALLLATGLILATPAVTHADAPPARFSLEADQSGFHDQLDRGTCGAHSAAAALEAAYRRQGVSVKLSEEFCMYATKLFWLEPQARTAPQVRESGLGFDEGVLGGSVIHFLANGLALPTDAAMPYRPHYGMGSPQARRWALQYDAGSFNLDPRRFDAEALARATYYSAKSFENLNARNPEAIKKALLKKREVIFGFNLDHTKRKPGDLWEPTVPVEKTTGGHSLLIVGYDETDPYQPHFLVKNSWGENRLIKFSYDYVRAYGNSAVTITEVASPRQWKELAALGRWYLSAGELRGVLDVYHLPGLSRMNFDAVRSLGGQVDAETDRRIGTFYRDGDPRQAYRVNGKVTPGGVELVIDTANANAHADATGGRTISLKFADGQLSRLTGAGAEARRLKAREAFQPSGQKVEWARVPELKGLFPDTSR